MVPGGAREAGRRGVGWGVGAGGIDGAGASLAAATLAIRPTTPTLGRATSSLAWIRGCRGSAWESIAEWSSPHIWLMGRTVQVNLQRALRDGHQRMWEEAGKGFNSQPCSAPAAFFTFLFQEIKFLAQPCSSLMSTLLTSTTLRTRWRSRPCSGPRAATSPPVTGTLSATTTTAPCWMAPGSSPRACPEHPHPSWGQTELGVGRQWDHPLCNRQCWSIGHKAAGWGSREEGSRDTVRWTWLWHRGCGTSWHIRMDSVGFLAMVGWKGEDFRAAH